MFQFGKLYPSHPLVHQCQTTLCKETINMDQNEDLQWNHKHPPFFKHNLLVCEKSSSNFSQLLLNPSSYTSESWTLTEAMERSLDTTYTRMLRTVQGVTGAARLTSRVITKLTEKIRAHWLKLVGPILRHKSKAASDVVISRTKEGKTRRERPALTYWPVGEWYKTQGGGDQPSRTGEAPGEAGRRLPSTKGWLT